MTTSAPTSSFTLLWASECLYHDTTKTLFTKTKKKIPNGRVLLSKEVSSASPWGLALRCFDFGTEQQLKSGGEGDTRQAALLVGCAQRLDVSRSQRERGWPEATKCLNRNAVELGQQRGGRGEGARATRKRPIHEHPPPLGGDMLSLS